MENANLVINGYGSGDGSGDGYGYGYGYGSGDGYGYGDGDGYGYGDGDGSGDGYGYGYGDGNGYGYGDGDGSGDGYDYGDGDGEFKIKKQYAWLAYHYIKKSSNGNYILRSQKQVKKGEVLTEKRIKICEYGLHASLSPEEARSYAPYGSVLTKVKIWGRIICQKDKLVATHRQIVDEVQ